VCRRPTALKASAVVDCRRRCWPSCSPCSALTATAQGRRGRQPLPAAAGSVGTGRGNGRYSNPTERCAGTASLNEKTASSPHPEKALEDKRAAWVRSWPHSGFGGRSRPPDAKLDIGEQIISAHIAHRHRPDATGSIHRARPAFEEAATALGVAQPNRQCCTKSNMNYWPSTCHSRSAGSQRAPERWAPHRPPQRCCV
jgi:hypothetical protein